jgi:hypothetical protein
MVSTLKSYPHVCILVIFPFKIILIVVHFELYALIAVLAGSGGSQLKAQLVQSQPMWQIPIQKIYRTVRIERAKAAQQQPALPSPQSASGTPPTNPSSMTATCSHTSSGTPACYALHVMVGLDGLPEVLLRIGSTPDTSIDGDTIRFKLLSPHQIESFIHSFKALIMIQDVHMKCTTDLTNPACFPLFQNKR